MADNAGINIEIDDIKFKVIDTKTGKEANPEAITKNEEWAKDLLKSDMESFALTENGDLVLLDGCGRYRFCPGDRFTLEIELSWGAEENAENC